MSLRTLFLASVTLAFACSLARANSGIHLPLSQYQAGTEQATLVPNGNFETITGADADGWTELGQFQAAPHVGPNVLAAVMGSYAAQSSTDESRYSQNFTFTPDTPYVLSSYLWNFGTVQGTNTDFAVIDLVDLADAAHILSLILEPTALDNGSAANGYFAYIDIPANTFPSGARLDLRADVNTTGAHPPIVLQWDNVALTPAAQFAPPQPIPEPAVVLGAMIALAMSRSRRLT